MEDEKKKKKNKKKKNKQQTKAAAAEDTSSNAGETSSVGTVSGEQDNVSNIIVEVDDKRAHNANGSTLADGGKQNWLQEEARLREMVKRLLYEKDSYLRIQADLEMRIQQLQCENDSWRQKEVSLEERIIQLLQEKTAVSFEENLQEKVQQIEKEKLLLVEKENSSKEMIATLNNEKTRLRMQVLELEGARNSLSQENRQLLDNISTLQSRIQDLEKSLPSVLSPADVQMDASEKENLNAQIEQAYSLIEKLFTENADLVEKINELYMELGRQRVVPDVTSVIIPEYACGPDPVSVSREDISSSARSATLSGRAPIGNAQVVRNDMDSNYANVARHSSVTTVSGEIVQIPLGEGESQDLEAQAPINEEAEGVPLTDAPLIGAPFRLISFFANYVSGADLVNKSSSDSLQEP